MKIYKIAYLYNFEGPCELFDEIELVKAQDIVVYVDKMRIDGRIGDITYNNFCEMNHCGKLGIMSESDAVGLLRADGYDVEEVEV